MGIVLRQSIINTLLTYAGFALGALNTLFLYTRLLTEVQFGLVGVILSTAALLMPVLAFGIPNTLIRYFPAYQGTPQANGFLTLMLLLPLLTVVPLGLCLGLAREVVAAFLSRENTVVGGYVWHIFAIGLAMGYFEVFFAWSKACLKSAWGTFLKEVFARLGVTLLLLALYLDAIGVEVFLLSLVGLYLLRTFWMATYALRLQPVRLRLQIPDGSRDMIRYSALILIGGSVSVLLLEIDRFMINQYIRIENVAYYTVSIFIATVIIVPLRAMHQITYPLTSRMVHEGDLKALSALYKRSSLGLFLVSGLIYLLILLNLDDLYAMLPENYRGGFQIVLLIGGAKLLESLLSINSAILYNSPYYRTLLWMGVLLATGTVVLNMYFIPIWGIFGAALATFLAVALYSLVKLWFVYRKYRMWPFSTGTLRVFLLGVFTWALFFRLEFYFHPLVNIALKSLLVCLLYLGAALRLRLSEDLNAAVSRFFQKRTPGA
ncbi:lipopolysaccharide biosynthesis protein [Robiginitalea sp. M366]|uniref:lipopolysaccharide biosynthesis protein n=1 Tax=Robiginitalea aestuariiviva TaxID=3036903 RepID=UPI00240D2E7B|nr:lipopolysaccharide biosynthesis protein [Robiginitalea aestuariiviva]MDG1573033.1 lipopolysaccharide biosynthesis protein [Robiginitalea aestuariiviva]